MRPRSRSAGLLVQQVGDQLVAYDQLRQRLHVLSPTAALTWRQCNGRNDVAALAELVSRELGIAPDERLIMLALEQLDEARLLEERLAPAASADAVSRREMLQWAAAAAAGVFLPTITSCGAPLGPDGGPTAPGGPRLGLGVDTTTLGTTALPTTTIGTTTLPPTTTIGTTTLPPTTTIGTTTLPPTTTIGTTTLPPTTTSTTTPFPPTTTTTPFPPTTTSTTSSPPTTTTSTTPAPKKVRLCHKGKSIMVDEEAVAMHLAHGDTLGPCP
jgi:hypothetical protein